MVDGGKNRHRDARERGDSVDDISAESRRADTSHESANSNTNDA